MDFKRSMSWPASSRALVIGLAVVFAALLVGSAGCAPQASSSASKYSSSGQFVELSDNSSSAEPEPGSSAAQPVADTVYSDALAGQLEAIAASSSLNVGIAFVDCENPADAVYAGYDGPQRSASMIKLIVLNELFNQVNQGLVSLDEGYTLTSSDIVGGTGVLQSYGAGATTTFGDMATLMISQSDNTATNVIINRLGMGSINARAQALGLESTSLNRLMMDTDALAAGIDNYMSARDAATLLQMVHAGTFVDQAASTFAMEALEAQTDSAGILAGLPSGVAFAHKTGTLSNAQNDAGIVLGSHPYVVAVFCDSGSTGAFSQSEAYGVMQQAGDAVSTVVGA